MTEQAVDNFVDNRHSQFSQNEKTFRKIR